MSDEFPSLTELFKPLLQLLMLTWKHSAHYNSPARLVVVLREICNDLITQASNYLAGQEILQDEPPVAVEKLKTTLTVMGTFKSYYFDYKVLACARTTF